MYMVIFQWSWYLTIFYYSLPLLVEFMIIRQLRVGRYISKAFHRSSILLNLWLWQMLIVSGKKFWVACLSGHVLKRLNFRILTKKCLDLEWRMRWIRIKSGSYVYLVLKVLLLHWLFYTPTPTPIHVCIYICITSIKTENYRFIIYIYIYRWLKCKLGFFFKKCVFLCEGYKRYFKDRFVEALPLTLEFYVDM